MEIVQSIPGMLFRLILNLWKKMLSLRAGGTTFDPEVVDHKDGNFLVFLNIEPGYDEVVFKRLQVKGCDLADTETLLLTYGIVDYIPKGEWRHDEFPLRIVVPPKTRKKTFPPIPIMIRPRTDVENVTFVLTGGILNRLSATRTLLD